MLRLTVHAFVAAIMLALISTTVHAEDEVFEPITVIAKKVNLGQITKDQMINNYAAKYPGRTLAEAVGVDDEEDIVFKRRTTELHGFFVGFVATSDEDDATEILFDTFKIVRTDEVEPYITGQRIDLGSPVSAELSRVWSTAKAGVERVARLHFYATPYGYVLTNKAPRSTGKRKYAYASTTGVWANADLVLRGIDMPLSSYYYDTLPSAAQDNLREAIDNTPGTLYLTPWGYRIVPSDAQNLSGFFFDHNGEEITGTIDEKRDKAGALMIDTDTPAGYLFNLLKTKSKDYQQRYFNIYFKYLQ